MRENVWRISGPLDGVETEPKILDEYYTNGVYLRNVFKLFVDISFDPGSVCGCSPDVRKSKTRHTPVDFTGCLAHGEVVYDQTHRVVHIRGFFELNEGCQTATFTRPPTFPIHPSVYEVALRQMRAGVTLAEVREANRKMYLAKAYSAQPQDLANPRFRWLITSNDTRSLKLLLPARTRPRMQPLVACNQSCDWLQVM